MRFSRPSLREGVKEVVIHIGIHKTASSFIQTNLARGTFTKQNKIHYPWAPSSLAARRGHITSGNLRNWDQVFREVENPAPYAEKLLFSNENLSSQLSRNDSDWQKLQELKKLAPVRLVAFHRNPISHSISSHQQAVKRGGVSEPLDVWLQNRTIWPLYKIFESAAEFQIPFETINYSTRSDIWASFVALCGARGKDLGISKPDSGLRVNRSLSEGELELQLAINKINASNLGRLVSDAFCNNAPTEQAATPILSEGTYQAFVQRSQGLLEKTNTWLSPREQLVFEPYNPEWAEAFARSKKFESVSVSGSTWNALVEFVSEASGRSPTAISEELTSRGVRVTLSNESHLSCIVIDKSSLSALANKIATLILGNGEG